MAGEIKRPLSSIKLFPTLFALFVGVTVLANTARAGDCIAAPNSLSPPGKHWWYRLDWATKRKCWYVGPLGQSVQEGAVGTVKGRPTHLRRMSARPSQQSQADHPTLSPSEAGPPSPPVKVITDKPSALSPTADDATASIPEIIAPRASTSTEIVPQGAAPASEDAPIGNATTDDTAVSNSEASAPQANSVSETGRPEVVRKSIAVSADSQVRRISDDVEPNVQAGEPTDNGRPPTTLLLYLALGLAAVSILPFTLRKLVKNETNKTQADADLTEVAASMALRLGRGRDSNEESGDLQQAGALVLNEAGCARDIEEPDKATAPTPIPHEQPRAKLTFNEYRQRIEACLNWAQEAPAERVVCLTLAEAWLGAALTDLAATERNNKSDQGLALPT
jgi:hypothetical protein